MIRLIRGVGIIQLFIFGGFVLANSPSLLLVAVGVVVVAVIVLAIAALNWWRYTFQVSGGEFRVKKGVLSQQELTVPLDRVQSVTTEQQFLHRVLGLVQVSLDTAGSSAAEFTIDAVEKEVATALQAATADHKANLAKSNPGTSATNVASGMFVPTDAPVGSEAEFVERVVIQHSFLRLAKLALTSSPFRGLAILAPLFAFGDDIVDRLPVDLPDAPENTDSLVDSLIWLIPLAILAVMTASIILNIIQTVLRDWNLRVTRTASGLRRDAGLLSTTSVASSVTRVQRIESSQGVLEKLVGLQTVTLHNIGDADITVPGCVSEQAEDLRQLGLDGADGVSVLDRRKSPTHVFRDTRNSLVLSVPLAVGLYFVLGLWSLFFLLITPLTWLQSRRSTRLYRWGISDDAIADRAEFAGWRKNESLLRKVNSVQVRQSLFERKRDLATVTIEMAGGVLRGGSISIGMIPIDEAMAVRDRVLFVTETDTRAFM